MSSRNSSSLDLAEAASTCTVLCHRQGRAAYCSALYIHMYVTYGGTLRTISKQPLADVYE